MRTRGGVVYEEEIMCCVRAKKRAKTTSSRDRDFFDTLPDDLVMVVLAKIASAAVCPSDYVKNLLICKRFHGLGLQSVVLSKASSKCFSVKAKNWCESAHKFLKLCADAGNIQACYTLGMIRFYCLRNRETGASLMAKAAISSHAQALYSLAVIKFNGSGGTKNDKDIRAGVALCARAAFLGHIDALRELGHCLQDGYGIRQSIVDGRRFLVHANVRELAAVLSIAPSSFISGSCTNLNPLPHVCSGAGHVCSLLSDFGCNVPAPEPHPANQFLTEWFEEKKLDQGLLLCSHVGCGRPETRKNEFRRCSVCCMVNYCSRACQALDWKMRHKSRCIPIEMWNGEVIDDDHDDEENGEANDEHEHDNNIDAENVEAKLENGYDEHDQDQDPCDEDMVEG